MGVFGYFGDADRSSWSGPVRFDEVPLVRWQQVILHCFYEKIFTGVVVLYQSFFLHDLKRRAHIREAGLMITFTCTEELVPVHPQIRAAGQFPTCLSVSEQKD